MKQDMKEQDYSFDTTEAIIQFQRLNFLQKIAIIEKGITKTQLDQFKQVSGLGYATIAKLMNVSLRYLHMKKDNDRFRPAMSDNIASLIDLYGFGYALFNDPPIFNRWIKTGCPQKRYIPPITFCDTIVGKEEAKREIFRVTQEAPSLYKWLYAADA